MLGFEYVKESFNVKGVLSAQLYRSPHVWMNCSALRLTSLVLGIRLYYFSHITHITIASSCIRQLFSAKTLVYRCLPNTSNKQKKVAVDHNLTKITISVCWVLMGSSALITPQ